MNRKKTVVLSGGLGNQLFQFCFAHVLAAHRSGTVSIYSPKPKEEARDFVLNSLCDNCSHIQKVALRRSWIIDLGFKCRDFIHFRFDYLFHGISNKFYYVEEDAYAHTYPHFSQKFYSGYFQNWRFVQEGLPLFHSELTKTLSKMVNPISVQLRNEPYGVVHFRRGDLLRYSNSMGILEDDYFLNAINSAFDDLQKRIKVIVLTDDKEYGNRSFAGVADEVYGPSDIDEWVGLNIMSQASFVITSNSTFSWWGALLASSNGGTAYIPDPWFLNWIPDPGSAFEYPGFKKVRSQFKKEF
jgi:hypothetical protein